MLLSVLLCWIFYLIVSQVSIYIMILIGGDKTQVFLQVNTAQCISFIFLFSKVCLLPNIIKNSHFVYTISFKYFQTYSDTPWCPWVSVYLLLLLLNIFPSKCMKLQNISYIYLHRNLFCSERNSIEQGPGPALLLYGLLYPLCAQDEVQRKVPTQWFTLSPTSVMAWYQSVHTSAGSDKVCYIWKSTSCSGKGEDFLSSIFLKIIFHRIQQWKPKLIEMRFIFLLKKS